MISKLNMRESGKRITVLTYPFLKITISFIYDNDLIYTYTTEVELQTKTDDNHV